MKVEALLHASMLVENLERARAFYEGVLGLTPSSSRPDMAFQGVWYDIGTAQIHLLCLPSPDPVAGRPEHGGRDRHVALAIADFDDVRRVLDDCGISYTLSRSGRRALFVRDPDGNALELVETRDAGN
jgi:glyoxylase I family protein